MKPMKKKLFSILLAVVMVLSLIPAITVSASATSPKITITSGSFEGYKGWLKANDGGDRYKQRGGTFGVRSGYEETKAYDGDNATYANTYGVDCYYPELYLNGSGELVRDTTYDNVNEDVDINEYLASGLGKYYGIYKFTLEGAATLDAITIISALDGGDVDSNKAFDVLYSADGTHWTVAGTYTNMKSQSNWTSVADGIATLNVSVGDANANSVAVAFSAASGRVTGGLWLYEVAVTGTLNAATPTACSNASELAAAIGAYGNDPEKTITLTDDIVLPDDWSATYVKGVFDGQGHTIYNLKGSFIWPYGNSVFQNFTISNKTASDGDTFTVTGQTNIFGGNADSSEIKAGETAIIRNVTNNRSLIGSTNYTGAFFGALTIAGTVRFENCTNNGDYQQIADPSVNNSYYSNNHKIGGFVGCMNSGTVEFVGCTNNGNINASQAGGFIGIYKNSTITMTNCTNRGAITGLSKAEGAFGIAGGFIGGYNNGIAVEGNTTITLTNCVNTNTGNIAIAYPSGTYRSNAIGGLIGHAGGSADGKTCTITLNNCGVYGCTINTNGADEYAAPLVGKCSPGIRDNYTVTANSCYVSRVNVIGGTARKLIGVGSNDENIEAVKTYNCVLNEVTENGSEEWNGSKYSGCHVKVTADNVIKNGFSDTDTANAISDGLAPVAQRAAAAEDTSKVRFLATLKDGALTSYDKVGFFITASYGGTVKGWNLSGTTVYTSILAAGASKSASEIYNGHASETYIFAATLSGISFAVPTDVTFNVTPYVVNSDGSVLFGLTGQFEISVGSL